MVISICTICMYVYYLYAIIKSVECQKIILITFPNWTFMHDKDLNKIQSRMFNQTFDRTCTNTEVSFFNGKKKNKICSMGTS